MAIMNQTDPRDTTGFLAEKKARQTRKDTQEAKDQLNVARAAEAAVLATEVHDPVLQAPIVLDEIEDLGISMADDSVIIRTIADIEDMTYGVGNTYNFKQGVKYKVPRSVADHLAYLGYTWQP
jgi:hypothetical protein